MTDLETRYRKLLRAYPAEWRAQREDEMTATYLDLAGDRTALTLADRWDVWRGAARYRASNGGRVFAGARAAADIALALGAAYSAYLFVSMEALPQLGYLTQGLEEGIWTYPEVTWPITRTYSGLIWGMWVVVAIAALAPARWTRVALLGLLAVALGDLPLTFAGAGHPQDLAVAVFYTLPAVPALAVGSRRSLVRRLLPLAAAIPTTVMALARRGVIELWDPSLSDLEVGAFGAIVLIASIAVSVAAYPRVGPWPAVFLAPAVVPFFGVLMRVSLADLMNMGAVARTLGAFTISGVVVAAGAALSKLRARGPRPPQAS